MGAKRSGWHHDVENRFMGAIPADMASDVVRRATTIAVDRDAYRPCDCINIPRAPYRRSYDASQLASSLLNRVA